jgi:zinc transport system ATP-binding protein
MSTSTGPPVRVDDVSFGYDHQVVLDKVSLVVEPGDYLAIIGPNGGGKTTLLKIILGLLKPWSGRVALNVSASHRAGYVPQYASFDKNFPLTVGEVVGMGRLGLSGLARGYSAADGQAVDAALDRFGLRKLASTCVAELSGGQLQRTLIARALAGEPEILFLDEPLASIDSESTNVVLSTLEDLNRRMPVVVISHDVTIFGGAVRQIACVNRDLHYHATGELTGEMLEEVYGCPVELVAHGVPHRVVEEH